MFKKTDDIGEENTKIESEENTAQIIRFLV